MFDLVIMVDWSASNAPGPARPRKDQIWYAVGTRDRRDPPVYCRTRHDCIERLSGILSRHAGSALVGLDFPFGYPLGHDAEPVLPVGRDLCRFFDDRLSDHADNRNDRFQVAARLNQDLAARTGADGPFWGRPHEHTYHGLPPKKPQNPGVPEWRHVERIAHARGDRPKSVWQMAYNGSVGSQAITGLAGVHRLIAHPDLGDRCRIWPFETDWDRALLDPDRPDTIVIAEIYPSLVDETTIDHPIKDARQVAAQRDWALDLGPALREHLAQRPALTTDQARACRDSEGWILGL